MSTFSYDYTPNVVTTSANYEVLQDTNFKNAIQDRLSITEAEYQALLTSDGKGLRDIRITMLFDGNTRLSINNDSYALHNLIDQEAFELSAGSDFIRRSLKSLRIEDTGRTATVILNVL